jgi:ubiquinone biosynthesis accessory factor UbiJ
MLTERIEALVNRQAASSPRAQDLLARLAGKRAVLVVRYTPFQIAATSDGVALRLSSRDVAGPRDVTVSGTPIALMQLAGDDPQAVIRRGDVTIEGDAELADRFRELGQLLRPELEEELSRVIGDLPAHRFGVVLRKAAGWLRQSAGTTATNVGEYLAHERRDLVPRAESEDFLRGVDELRETVDRLEARIDALAARAGDRP